MLPPPGEKNREGGGHQIRTQNKPLNPKPLCRSCDATCSVWPRLLGQTSGRAGLPGPEEH